MATSKKNKEKLNFSDFKLETIVAELRYPFTFILWDVAGELWHELEEKLPAKGFIITEASPASVTVTYADKYEIGIQQERFVLNTSIPNVSLPEFFEILKVVFDLVTEKLQIEVFNRIGFRQVFVKPYSNIKKAVADLRTLPSIQIPPQILLGNENNYIAPGFSIRIEDGKKGKIFRLQAQNRRFEISIPPQFVSEANDIPNVFTQSIIVFDIDSYTQVQTTVGQLSIVDWFKQAHATIVKDAEKFF